MLLQYQDLQPTVGSGVYLAPTAVVIGDVHIGDRSSIWFGAVLRGDIDRIQIGSDTSIQDNVVVHVTGGIHPTCIGNRVIVGHSAILHGCTIDDDALIGMGAIILDGACIGRGAIVAAGSLVKEGQQVPPDTLVAGSPATVRRPLSPSDRENMARIIGNYRRETESYLNGALQRLDPQ